MMKAQLGSGGGGGGGSDDAAMMAAMGFTAMGGQSKSAGQEEGKNEKAKGGHAEATKTTQDPPPTDAVLLQTLTVGSVEGLDKSETGKDMMLRMLHARPLLLNAVP
jgi:hypothetical protein